MDSKESESHALDVVIRRLSSSYQTHPDTVAFCVGLARSNMRLVQRLGRQVGEFELDMVNDLFKLVMRLTPICRSSDETSSGGGGDGESGGGSKDGDSGGATVGGGDGSDNHGEGADGGSLTPAEVGSSGGGRGLLLDPHQIFSQCVPGGESFMSFGEFKTAMKILDLNSHDHRLLELFLMGDFAGTGLLSADAFSKLLQKTTDALSNDVKMRIGEDGLRYFARFSGAVGILLALFVFVLIGVEAFSLSGGFAAVTSGSLFATIAGFMQSQGSNGLGGGGGADDAGGGGDEEADGGESGGGEDGASGIDTGDPQEVAAVLEDILSVHSVD